MANQDKIKELIEKRAEAKLGGGEKKELNHNTQKEN